MTFGPIDFIALEFPGNRFRGEILPDLFELVDKEIIRIIDLVIIIEGSGPGHRAGAARARSRAHRDVRPAEGRREPDDHG